MSLQSLNGVSEVLEGLHKGLGLKGEVKGWNCEEGERRRRGRISGVEVEVGEVFRVF